MSIVKNNVAGLVSLVFCFGSTAFAQTNDFYCEERELGGQFYCEEEIEEERGAPAAPAPAPMEREDEVIKDFDSFKEQIDKARSVAVFTGDPDDIEKYMRLQKEAGVMASKFTEEYKVLGWQDPTLSYVSSVPVETFAKNAYRADRRSQVEEHIKKINGTYGFFYFYSKNCSACTQMSPVVKMLSSRYELNVMPIAKAGKESIEWPGTKPDNGIGARVGLIGDVTPAVVLYDATQDAAIPISYGAISLETLEDRIYMLTRKDKVKFLGGDTDVR